MQGTALRLSASTMFMTPVKYLAILHIPVLQQMIGILVLYFSGLSAALGLCLQQVLGHRPFSHPLQQIYY
jgi:hypothetical protein